MVWSCFKIQFASPYLLISVIKPFTLTAIIDITIIWIIYPSELNCHFSPLLSSLSLSLIFRSLTMRFWRGFCGISCLGLENLAYAGLCLLSIVASFQPLFVQLFFQHCSLFCLFDSRDTNHRIFVILSQVPKTLFSLKIYVFCCSNHVIYVVLISVSLFFVSP